MYGSCVFLGILVSVLLGEKLCEKRNLDKQAYWRAVFFVLIFGLLGARFYHVLHRLHYFLANPLEILFLWKGGFGIWGAVFGGLGGFFLSFVEFSKNKNSSKKFFKFFKAYTHTKKEAPIYLDIFAVCAPLAQSIGRWGNFFNNELFGYPTTLPWGIYIPADFRPPQFKYYDTFHPLFIYESALNFILFLLLYRMYIDFYDRFKGLFVLFYLLFYSTFRFFLEFLRLEKWVLFGFPVASGISVLVFGVCVCLFFVKYKIGYKNNI